jgi:cobalt/nickel transport protein
MKKTVFLGLLIAMLLAIFSFMVSSSPDGLERIAENHNFLKNATNFFKAPIADYLFPGIKNEQLATSLAGLTGVIIVFLLGIILGKLLKKKNETRLY